MITVGIDVGSISTRAVLLDGGKMFFLAKPTGWSPGRLADCFAELLDHKGYNREQIDYMVATGHGRIALPFASQVVTGIPAAPGVLTATGACPGV